MAKLEKLDFLMPEHKATFIIDKIEYHSISQWMAAAKATLFRDDEAQKRIMKQDSPHHCETLAKSIKGYNRTVCGANILQLLYRGMKAKLLQNTLLYLDFITTEDTLLGSDLFIKLKNEFLMITND